MASVIRIKRSGVTGSPTALAQGELAYSYLSGSQANGGDRLYIGTGTEVNGEAANIEVIGGKYFTEKLDHVPGAVTANSALIVDANSKLDILNVDNITINGNAITSTDLNGNIQLSPNGSGSVDVATSKIINLVDPTSNQDAATKAYVDSEIGAIVSDFTIAGDSGTDTFLTGQTLTFAGATGITTAVTDNQVSIDLDDTAVTPGSYGSSTEIPTFTVDQQGRLTAAGTAQIATGLSMLGDSGTDTVQLLTGTLIFSGNNGITTDVSDDRLTISGTNATTTARGVASFNTANFTVTNGAVSTKNVTIGSSAVAVGGTITTIAGLTQVDIGDLRYNNNSISATDVNGSITLSPSGDGFVSVDDSLIKNVADPLEGTDAANKRYVDEVASGLIVRGSVEAATTGNIAATYDNGTDGVGATLTIAPTSSLNIDGWTSWSLYDGILVKNQTNAAENGRYFVSQIGDAVTSWILTRCFSCDEPDEIVGSYVFVSHGTTYESSGWVATVDNVDTFAVGTDDIDWIQFSGAGTYLAGNGLNLNGTEFSVDVDDATIFASTTERGVASFSSSNFSVTSGAVSLTAVDGGSY